MTIKPHKAIRKLRGALKEIQIYKAYNWLPVALYDYYNIPFKKRAKRRLTGAVRAWNNKAKNLLISDPEYAAEHFCSLKDNPFHPLSWAWMDWNATVAWLRKKVD